MVQVVSITRPAPTPWSSTSAGAKLNEPSAAVRDTLRMAGLLLGMPLGLLVRLRESVCEVVSLTGEWAPGIQAGQRFSVTPETRRFLYSGQVEPASSPVYSLPPFSALGLRTYVGVPVTLDDDQTRGFLAAADTIQHDIAPDTLDAFGVLGRLLAHEFDRVERERELRALAQVSQAFVRSGDLSGTFSVIIEQAVGLFQADYCLLHRIDLSNGEIYVSASHGVDETGSSAHYSMLDNAGSATMRVVRSRRTLWIPDARNSELPDQEVVERYGLASILILPLVVGDEIEGVLTIGHSGEPYEFSASQLRVAEIMANEAAMALRRQELIEAMKERQHELSIVNNLARVATSSVELKPLLRQLADELSRVIDATDSFIVLRDEQGLLRPAAASARHYDAYRRFPVLPDERSITAAVVARREPIVLPDVEKSEHFNPRILAHFPMRAAVAVPLIARGKVLGAALIGDDRAPREFSDYEVRLVQMAATQVSLAIANAQLFEEVSTLAVHDALTGAYNRRHLERVLREEVSRSKRYQRSLSCAMLDLDHFKSVNDRYGHALGDAVLQELAVRLRRTARSSDIVARFGGEEFAVVLPETRLQEAALTAERLRFAISGEPFRLPLPLQQGQMVQLSLTISVGVAELTPSVAGGRELLERADSALYEAKEAGRNRIAFYHEEHRLEGEPDLAPLEEPA